MKIQDYLNNREKFEVNYTYRTPDGKWSSEDEQCFIDSILRGEPTPMIILNETESVYRIVDGKQRLLAILKFYKNKIQLNTKFSGTPNGGKTYGGDSAICETCRLNFLHYELPCSIVKDYDTNHIKVLLSRMQRGRRNELPIFVDFSGQFDANRKGICMDSNPPCMPWGILYKNELSQHYLKKNGTSELNKQDQCDVCMRVYQEH